MGQLEGYLGAFSAVVLFGSNFLPVKTTDSGDGMFFQFMMCCGIWTVGLCVNIIRGSPVLYPLAMLGGLIWCSGNIMVVFIIQRIGMGLGLLIWGFTGLLMGWATGFFGWFGLPPDDIHIGWLNILGVAFASLSLGVAFFIKPSTECTTPIYHELELDFEEQSSPRVTETVTLLRQPSAKAFTSYEQCCATVAACVAGILFGSNFNPSTYIMKHNYNGESTNPLDYVFAHFCGILLWSMFLFLCYCGYMHNSPIINPKVCLPAYFSGVLWGLAQVGMFVANAELGYTIAFPIVQIGPGVVGLLWGVLCFNEVTGLKNLYLLGTVLALVVVADLCIMYSH